MPRTRLLAVGLSVALLAGACGGDEDRDAAKRDDESGKGASVTSDDEPRQDARSDVSTAPVRESDEAPRPGVASPVRLGERFEWCARVQALWDTQDEARAIAEAAAVAHRAAVGVYEAATDELDRAEAQEAVDDAFADYAFAARDYGASRWKAAGLIFSYEDVMWGGMLGGEVEDTTLQVALERAFEAYRANAAADTLAAFDFAHEATDTATRLYAVAYSDKDEPDQAVEAIESEPAPFDASEAWFRATEAYENAIEAAEDAEEARMATLAAAEAVRTAIAEAKDAAQAIYRAAAQTDGDWEVIATDIQAHLTAARSAAEAAAGFAVRISEAQAAAEAAAQAAKIAVEASEAARTLAAQSGMTEGAQTYWDIRAETPSVRYHAEFSASRAAASASSPDVYVARAAQAVEDAAWRAARISADIDAGGVAAFKDSLQISCR